MTPELQSVLDRLEQVERGNRRLRSLATFALLAGLAGLAAGLTARIAAPPAPGTRPAGVVEGTRFLLRDASGVVRGGMEVERGGTVKLAIGNQDGHSGAAVILAQPTGLVQIQLRSPNGVVRAALNGSVEPSLTLASDDGGSGAALATRAGGPGQLLLSDRSGALHPAR